MKKFLSDAKVYVLYAIGLCKAVYANLTPSQRRKVYTAAMGVGVAVAAKLGIDATTAVDWITFAVTLLVTVVVPAFAKSKVDDIPEPDFSTDAWQGDA